MGMKAWDVLCVGILEALAVHSILVSGPSWGTYTTVDFLFSKTISLDIDKINILGYLASPSGVSATKCAQPAPLAFVPTEELSPLI